jgi:hypothetical protein
MAGMGCESVEGSLGSLVHFVIVDNRLENFYPRFDFNRIRWAHRNSECDKRSSIFSDIPGAKFHNF